MKSSSFMFTAVIHREEDMYVAKCPEVGTISQGSTVDEAVKNLKEATELYLEEFPIKSQANPILTMFNITKTHNDCPSQVIRA